MVTSYTYGGISPDELEDFRKDVQKQLDRFKTMTQDEIDAWFKELMGKIGSATSGDKKSSHRRSKVADR